MAISRKLEIREFRGYIFLAANPKPLICLTREVQSELSSSVHTYVTLKRYLEALGTCPSYNYAFAHDKLAWPLPEALCRLQTCAKPSMLLISVAYASFREP